MVSVALKKTGSKLEEINRKLLSLEDDVKVERWRSSPFSDHIRHTIAPISVVLRVFATVQELEKSLISSNEVLDYVSDVKRLGEAMKLLSNSCVLALNWLEDTIEFLTENGMPEDHPCGLRFKTSIELLRELQMTEALAYLRGGSLCTALENLETEFNLILEEEVLSESNLRKLQAIIKILDADTRLTNCIPAYIKTRTTVIQKRFEIDYLQKTITEADNEQDIEGDIDQWRLDMEIFVKEIYEFESNLCYEVFEDVGDEHVPLHCFGAIASNSGFLTLLRFGSRISKCKKSPPKLLKLLDCFSCQVELQRPNCPPLDAGVPKLVSVVTEYCNKLLGNNNKPILSKILEIYLGWKNEKYQEEILTGHIYNILREIALNLDAWSSSTKETDLSYIFMMNNHSHFCGLRETHLGKMMGESWLNAHEQYRDYYAALYVKESWGKLLSLLKAQPVSSSSWSPAKRKRARESIKRTLEAFGKSFDEIYRKQSNWVVDDEKLRWKICEALVRTVVPRYKSYLQSYIMLLVEEDPTSPGKDLYYTPKGLEMKLKTMFQSTEETE